MKNLILSITLFAIGLWSCSKKAQIAHFNQINYQNTAHTADRNETHTTHSPNATSGNTVATPHIVHIEEATQGKNIIQKNTSKKIAQPIENKTTTSTFKKKIAEKVAKKIEKQLGKSGLEGNLRIGIIVGSIGITMMLLGVIIGGGVGWVFTIIGALALIFGLVLVLLELV